MKPKTIICLTLTFCILLLGFGLLADGSIKNRRLTDEVATLTRQKADLQADYDRLSALADSNNAHWSAVANQVADGYKRELAETSALLAACRKGKPVVMRVMSSEEVLKLWDEYRHPRTAAVPSPGLPRQ